jgi:hypothetical protein
MALVLSHAYYNCHGRVADLFLEGKSLIDQTKRVGYMTHRLKDTLLFSDEVVEAQNGGCHGAMKACRRAVSPCGDSRPYELTSLINKYIPHKHRRGQTRRVNGFAQLRCVSCGA